jgi:hypothetical protein
VASLPWGHKAAATPLSIVISSCNGRELSSVSSDFNSGFFQGQENSHSLITPLFIIQVFLSEWMTITHAEHL